MSRSRRYAVYILASRTRALYIGVTNDLARRLCEHRQGLGSHFALKYRTVRLVHIEFAEGAEDAIARKKQIKRWRREKKEQLIASANPRWVDLSGFVLPDSEDE